MLRLNSKITIAKAPSYSQSILMDFVNDVEIESSWENLTDTAKITIPRKITWEGRDIVAGANPLFSRGDKVVIELGYDNQYNKVFVGYASAVHPKLPVVIECQDSMYLLKQNTITESYKSVKLSKLLSDVMPKGVKYEANLDATDLGKFRISNATPAQVLEELRKTYGIFSFFRDEVLHVGLAYVPKLRVEKRFKFEQNIIDDSLEYRRKDDVKYKVKAISIQPDNSKREVEFGDAEGEQRTIYLFDTPESQLLDRAKREFERVKYEGYYGSFTTFGSPFVRHNDAAILVSDKLPEKDGTYLIKKVVYRFGMSGYRQEITLDAKIK